MLSIGERIHIDLDERSYNIIVGEGLLGAGDTFEGLPSAQIALIVSNPTVAPLYLEALRSTIEHRFSSVYAVLVPDGEAYKNWETLQLIFDALLSNACDRKTVLFALGGGVGPHFAVHGRGNQQRHLVAGPRQA